MKSEEAGRLQGCRAGGRCPDSRRMSRSGGQADGQRPAGADPGRPAFAQVLSNPANA